MRRCSKWIALPLLAGAVSGLAKDCYALKLEKADGPETVLATFRIKAERLPEFLKMMPEYWKALRDRDLVTAAPYVLMVGKEDGKPVIYEVFSRKNHEAADHVPAAIQAFWDRMNDMVESRGGRAGIDFPEVELVSPSQ